MKSSRILSIFALAIGLCVLPNTPALAGPFDGTYEGKARVEIAGERTWVFVELVINNQDTKVTLFRYDNGTVGTELDQFDVTAFLDNRGVFFGILSKDGNIVAGIGGRINGRGDNGRVLGKFIQENLRRPFVLKEVEPL